MCQWAGQGYYNVQNGKAVQVKLSTKPKDLNAIITAAQDMQSDKNGIKSKVSKNIANRADNINIQEWKAVVGAITGNQSKPGKVRTSFESTDDLYDDALIESFCEATYPEFDENWEDAPAEIFHEFFQDNYFEDILPVEEDVDESLYFNRNPVEEMNELMEMADLL